MKNLRLKPFSGKWEEHDLLDDWINQMCEVEHVETLIVKDVDMETMNELDEINKDGKDDTARIQQMMN